MLACESCGAPYPEARRYYILHCVLCMLTGRLVNGLIEPGVAPPWADADEANDPRQDSGGEAGGA